MIGKTKHIHLKMISVTLNVIYGNNICFKTMYSIYTCLYIYVCECLFTKNVNIFTKNAIYIYTHTHIYIYFAMLCSHIHAYTFYAVVVHSVMSGSLRPHGLQLTRLPCPWSSPGKNTGVGSCSHLQHILTTQGSNPGLPYCSQILCRLSHKGSPFPQNNFLGLKVLISIE